MFSGLVELASFGALVVGVDWLAGPGWAWIAAGVLGSIVGVGTNDSAVRRGLLRFWLRVKGWRLPRKHAPQSPPSPHPAPLVPDEELQQFAEWAAESAARRLSANQ